MITAENKLNSMWKIKKYFIKLTLEHNCQLNYDLTAGRRIIIK